MTSFHKLNLLLSPSSLIEEFEREEIYGSSSFSVEWMDFSNFDISKSFDFGASIKGELFVVLRWVGWSMV